jgi:hypothetical protein
LFKHEFLSSGPLSALDGNGLYVGITKGYFGMRSRTPLK